MSQRQPALNVTTSALFRGLNLLTGVCLLVHQGMWWCLAQEPLVHNPRGRGCTSSILPLALLGMVKHLSDVVVVYSIYRQCETKVSGSPHPLLVDRQW
jgi:hypothetical protein